MIISTFVTIRNCSLLSGLNKISIRWGYGYVSRKRCWFLGAVDGEKEQVDTLSIYVLHSIRLQTPDFATLTSHSFLHKLPTRGKLICLLFYERAFHFPKCALLSLAVFNLLGHAIGLCWFNIWKGLIQFSFVLYTVQLDLTGSHIPVSALTVNIIFHVPLGFRDDFKFLSHLLWLFLPPYMLAWFYSFTIHSSSNQSTNICSVPAVCQSLWQALTRWGLWQ